MAKEKVFTILTEKLGLADQVQKDVEIKSASLKDALCSYSYELLTGKTKGDGLSRNGKHIIHEDLQIAFDKFDVFLAHLDDAFTGNDNATELSFLKEETETESYYVNSFSISGVEENRSLVLSGYKEVSNGVIKFSAPKVKLNGSYLYLTQLIECLDNAIREVEFYMNGKSAPQPEQMHMDFASEDASFENAKLDEEAV
ncbi:hypothetical protein ACM55H_05355 [Flavobacterium sp. ZT3R17]|uniref:hypothetical protein n=1 Tax=Flavobacterium cryoconiti TaxID=3398736 RepID=UPI003A89CA58